MTTEATGQTTTPTAERFTIEYAQIVADVGTNIPAFHNSRNAELALERARGTEHEPTHLVQFSNTAHGRADGCWEFEILNALRVRYLNGETVDLAVVRDIVNAAYVQYGGNLSLGMESTVAAWLVENFDRLTDGRYRLAVLDELEAQLVKGTINAVGGAFTVAIGDEVPRMLTRNETLKFGAPTETGTDNAVTLEFSDIVASESSGNLIEIDLPSSTEEERDGVTVEIDYDIAAVWLVDRVGAVAEGGDSDGRGTQRLERQASALGNYSIAAHTAEGSGRTLRVGIDDSYTVVGLRVVITRTEEPVAD